MPETRLDNPIEITQRWLEAEIIGHSICPPLVKITRPFRDPSGKVDWGKVEDKITFHDLTKKDPKDRGLINQAAEIYTTFLYGVSNGTAPVSRVVILPDFDSNSTYDQFMSQVQASTGNALLTERGSLAGASLFDRVAQEQNLPMETIVRTMMGGPSEIAVQLIDGAFRPVYFYGQRVSEQDTEGLSTDRGPMERYKRLMRAPFYMFQLVDILMEKVYSPYDSSLVHQRNTRLALATNIEEHESTTRRFRES